MTAMNFPENITNIAATFAASGFSVFCVGGAVRDAMRGATPHDFDLCTDATPEEVESVARRSNWAVLPIENGREHGVTVCMVRGERVEIATMRRDVETDGHHARVVFSRDIREDIQRRDLTVNAFAVNILTGEIFSVPNGFEDLQNGVSRFVGDGVTRIIEDRGRAVRPFRFGTLHQSAHNAIVQSIRDGILTRESVSGDRVRDELCKTLRSARVVDAMQGWMDTGVIGVFMPELCPMQGHAQNIHHDRDVWGHTLQVIAAARASEIHPAAQGIARRMDISEIDASTVLVRVAALFHDAGKPETAEFRPDYGFSFIGHENASAAIAETVMRRLRFPNDEIAAVCAMVAGHMDVPNVGDSPRRLRRWAVSVQENASALIDLRSADRSERGGIDGAALRSEIADAIAPIVNVTANPPVNGGDVMRTAGIRPGREVGRILAALRSAWVDNPELTRENLIAMIGTV